MSRSVSRINTARSRPLPRLRGSSREEVARDQRRRIHAGAAGAFARYGYSKATVRRMIEPVSISRRTFYELFGDRADIFLAVHAEALAELAEGVSAAANLQRRWPEQIAAGVSAALDFSAASPDRALLLIGGPSIAGPWAGHAQDALLARFEPSLRAGRALVGAAKPATLEAVLIGGIAGVVAARLRAGRAEELSPLAVPLAEFVLAPYVDAAEARATAVLPSPPQKEGENFRRWSLRDA